VENERYRWLVTVSPFTPTIENFDPATLPILLFKVNVMVTWGDDQASERQIELTNLRLVNKTL
jgi:general secretion pathway protein I